MYIKTKNVDIYCTGRDALDSPSIIFGSEQCGDDEALRARHKLSHVLAVWLSGLSGQFALSPAWAGAWYNLGGFNDPCCPDTSPPAQTYANEDSAMWSDFPRGAKPPLLRSTRFRKCVPGLPQ